MADAGGRLPGTLLSGLIFQLAGFKRCLWGSAAIILPAALSSLELPRGNAVQLGGAVEVAG
jgi:hypothetical protein